jgi:hypothetical protein
MVFNGVVESVGADEVGCTWAALKVSVSVGERVCTECAVRVAIPRDATDNPWRRKGDEWRP